MTTTEYIAKVIHYYSQNKPKIGQLYFDETLGRFRIKDFNGKVSKIAPSDCEIHCGDIYIVKNHDDTWRITQCELTDTGWKMLGSEITQKNCNDNLILWVKNKKLTRITGEYINESFNLGELSNDFVTNYLVGKRF